MSMDLRPLTLGELLDRAFSLYRRHFWLFVGLMALPSVFALALGLAMQMMQGQVTPADPEAISASDAAQMREMATFFVTMVVGFLGIMAAYWVAYMVALGATTMAVSELYLGRTATVGSAYSRMRGQVGRLVWLMILISLRLTGIFLLMGIGTAVLTPALLTTIPLLAPFVAIAIVGGGLLLALFLVLRYGLSVPALVLENTSARDAIRRSIDLTRGSLGRVFVLILFAMLITYAAMAIFQGPFFFGAMAAGRESPMAFWLNLLGTMSGSVAGAISGPLMIIALALLYYDVRIRKEGLDLQIMMRALGAPSASLADGRPSPALPG